MTCGSVPPIPSPSPRTRRADTRNARAPLQAMLVHMPSILLLLLLLLLLRRAPLQRGCLLYFFFRMALPERSLRGTSPVQFLLRTSTLTPTRRETVPRRTKKQRRCKRRRIGGDDDGGGGYAARG